MLVMTTLKCPFCRQVVLRLWEKEGHFITDKIFPCTHYRGETVTPDIYVKYSFAHIAALQNRYYLFVSI